MHITIHNRWILVAVAAALAMLVWSIYSRPEEAKSATFPGQVAKVATSSEFHLKPNTGVPIFGASIAGNWNAFATSTNCTSRTISTKTAPIVLSFVDGATSSPIRGHIQAASTTVNYDAELYGCGRVTAYSMVSDATVTIISITETTY